MPHLKLLSNGNYHVMVTADGTGYSQCGKLAVTRWHEDAVLDDCGTFCYLRDEADGHFWSTSSRPTMPRAVPRGTHFDELAPTLLRRDDGIEARTEIAVALGLSPLTVKSHVQQALRKLSVANRAEAAALTSGMSFASDGARG